MFNASGYCNMADKSTQVDALYQPSYQFYFFKCVGNMLLQLLNL